MSQQQHYYEAHGALSTPHTRGPAWAAVSKTRAQQQLLSIQQLNEVIVCLMSSTNRLLHTSTKSKQQLGAYFDIEGRNTYLTAELRAGAVAFLTVSLPETPQRGFF